MSAMTEPNDTMFASSAAFLHATARPVVVDAEADEMVARLRDCRAAVCRMDQAGGVPGDLMNAVTAEHFVALSALMQWMGRRGVLAVVSRAHGILAHVTGECTDTNDGIGLMPLSAVAGLDA